MTNFGEIHTADVYFKGTSGPLKRRPVLIVDDSEPNLITIVEITSEGPTNPPKFFDHYKVKISDWQAAGLYKKSWAKCHKENVHRIPKNRVIKRLGRVQDTTMIEVLEKIYN